MNAEFWRFRVSDTIPRCAISPPAGHPSDRYRQPTFEARWSSSRCRRVGSGPSSTVDPSTKRAPNLRVFDRIVVGVCTLLMKPARILRSAVVLKPSTLLGFHRALVQRKYRLLFSPKRRQRPGPKGPERELVAAVIDMKRRNPTWGCPRIAKQVTLAFGVDIDKDDVRRILERHYRPQTRIRRTVLADIARPNEGQFVERGLISLRIARLTDTLGSCRDGSIQSSNRGLRRSTRCCRRAGPLPDVPTSDSVAVAAEISEYGPRSVVPVSSVASEPAGSGNPTNPVRTLCAVVASVH
jgi:hypothetical protein